MKKIRICYILVSLGHGRAGTEKNLLTIISHLDRTQFEPFLICLQDGEYLQKATPPCETRCLHIYKVATPQFWSHRKKIAKLLAEWEIDIVQTFFVEANLLGGSAAKLQGIHPIISTRRDLGFSYKWKELLLLKFANRYPTRYLANSKAVAGAISKIEKTPIDQFDVIYNGIPDSGPRSIPFSLSTTPLVTLLANLRPVKCPEVFISAAKIVLEQVTEVSFALIGDGKLRKSLEEKCREFGIAGRVQFLGSLPNPEDVLKQSRIGVLTSSSEGCSNAIIEYMLTGLPVVATRVGGNLELVEDGKNGYLVAPNHPEELAEKLIRLLNSPDSAELMGQNSRQLYEEKFTLSEMVNNYQNYYQNLMSAK